MSADQRLRVVMLLYPDLTQLDLTGPYDVLASCPELEVLLAWKNLDPVTCARGLSLLPKVSLADCPQADILFVPGGPGQMTLMEDEQVLGFLRRQAAAATWITSVCTGSLVLGAAGLLDGYRATCHWMSLEQLALFGALPIAERVVADRNRLTGAGVTSGIDFALTLVATLFGEERAQAVMLAMEYDPAPPFTGGSPKSAEPVMVERARERAAGFMAKRLEISKRAAARL